MGFAFGAKEKRAELMMTHCGIDLNQAWLHYMESREASQSPEFKLKVIEMAQQVLSGLKKLHEIGYCHWDMKLDNICLTNGFYYLIDFALAQRIMSPHSTEASYRKISYFKGNSMFASIRKYKVHPLAAPIDDIESFLYLVCFCMDEFYLPWLNDYIKQTSTDQFIANRLRKHERHHQYLYQQMPGPLSQALQYVHRLNERNQTQHDKEKAADKARQKEGKPPLKRSGPSKEIQPDCDFLMGLFD